MLSHIVLTDIMGEDILLPTDFMFANRGKVKKPPGDGDERGKIVAIDKQKVQMIDCTIIHIHEELGIAVLETPKQILEKLTEAHTYDGYTLEESDEEDEDPDPEDPDDPAVGAELPKLLTGSE